METPGASAIPALLHGESYPVHMQQDSSDPTGVSGEEGSPGLVRARERKSNAALRLKDMGASWQEIADVLGYPTARAACVAVEKALERELQTSESQARMRQMASRRLDSLLRSVSTKAHNPNHPEHLAAVSRAADIVGRWIKLHGLDAPTEVVIHSPSQTELEAWVGRVLQQEVPALEEGNIFDAEWHDDEDPEIEVDDLDQTA